MYDVNLSSIYLSIYSISIYLSIINRYIYLSIYPSIHPSIYLSFPVIIHILSLQFNECKHDWTLSSSALCTSSCHILSPALFRGMNPNTFFFFYPIELLPTKSFDRMSISLEQRTDRAENVLSSDVEIILCVMQRDTAGRGDWSPARSTLLRSSAFKKRIKEVFSPHFFPICRLF